MQLSANMFRPFGVKLFEPDCADEFEMEQTARTVALMVMDFDPDDEVGADISPRHYHGGGWFISGENGGRYAMVLHMSGNGFVVGAVRQLPGREPEFIGDE